MEELCLIKDKYLPKSLDDIEHNQKLINKCKIYSKHKEIDNMIFIGSQGIGKYTIIKLLLAEIYGNSIFKLKKKFFEIENKGKNDEIEIIFSNYHYEIDVIDLKFSDLSKIISFLKEYITNKNIFSVSYNIVIIKNFDKIGKCNQFALRRIIEKHYKSCRFILIAKSLSNINEAILSRCILFRLQKINEIELSSIIVNCSIKNNLKIEKKHIEKIIKLSNNNITKALSLLELVDNNIIDIFDNINYDLQYDKIISIITSFKDIKDINILRDIIYKLLFDLNPSIILENITLKILKDYDMDISLRNRILELSTKSDEALINGFRPIYHIEYFCISLINLLN